MHYTTAGESHGRGLTVIAEGLPAGMTVDADRIDRFLALRQSGYGRGERMRIESDHAVFLSGVRNGKTIGSPVTVFLKNRDDRSDEVLPPLTRPRPGHADLEGALKFEFDDTRPVSERASARQTAAEVAVGALCIQLLEALGIRSFSHVTAIGGIHAAPLSFSEDAMTIAEQSPVRCADREAAAKMQEAIDRAGARGDSLGGIAEVVFTGLCGGIGSYTARNKKLDARLAFALMGIPSVKGVEIGDGFDAADRSGSEFHDPILYRNGFSRPSNHAGGIEGGMSNGQPIVLRVAFKPIPSLGTPLESVDLSDRSPAAADLMRSDCCIVPAGGIIAQCAAASVLAEVLCEQFGEGTMRELTQRYRAFAEKTAR